MMGVQAAAARFFYDFCLDDHVPKDHQLRGIDRHLDLDGIRAALKPFYSSTGRPSVDPELMIRMLLVGYCLGIRSERRLCEEVHLNLAYRWFCRLGLDGKKGAAREHRELFVSKLATVALGVLAIVLGIVAEKLNVAFAVGLAFAVAASCNFPVLVMSIFWRGMTTRGTVIGGFLDLVTAFVGVVLSPGIWVDVLAIRRARHPSPTPIPRCSRSASPFSAFGSARSSTSASGAGSTGRVSTRNSCARRLA